MRREICQDGIFGIFGVGCGIYCLYGYYMLKVRGEILQSLFLPKDADLNRCKDLKGYCNEAQMPALVLGIIVLIYGAVDLYNTYIHGVTVLLLAATIISVFAALVFFCLRVKKINKKYFDI